MLRKILKKPHEESASLFLVAEVQYIFSLLALSAYTLTTTVYQTMSITMNVIVIGMIVIGRKLQQIISSRQ